MENAIILSLVYIAIIAFLNSPKKTSTESAPIEYFPEIEDEEITPKPEIIQPELETKSATESLMFSLMPIRKLYAIAKKEGIKNYKAMPKAQLCVALAGVQPVCSV